MRDRQFQFVGARAQRPRRAPHPGVNAVADLQTSAGNRAVSELIAGTALPVQRATERGDGGRAIDTQGTPIWLQWDATITQPLRQVVAQLRAPRPEFRRLERDVAEIQVATSASEAASDPRFVGRAMTVNYSVEALHESLGVRTGSSRHDERGAEGLVSAALTAARDVEEVGDPLPADVAIAEIGPLWASWEDRVVEPLTQAQAELRRIGDPDNPPDFERISALVGSAFAACGELGRRLPGRNVATLVDHCIRILLSAADHLASIEGAHMGHDAIVARAEIAHTDSVQFASWASIHRGGGAPVRS
jgi:hypothetical protein